MHSKNNHSQATQFAETSLDNTGSFREGTQWDGKPDRSDIDKIGKAR